VSSAAAESLRRAAAHALVDDLATPVLDDAATHHLFRVLRVRDGEMVTVTDGNGGWRECRAASGTIEPVADPVTEIRVRRPVTIAFAVPKHDRPEWIVQKLTEIGVDRIVLVHAERSVVRWDTDRAVKHLARLERVAAEALQQSRRVWLPTISGPVPSAEILPSAVAAEPGARPLGHDDLVVAVGPEGGWSRAELDLAADLVSLGPGVLRVETAAIVAAARLHAE
jgi:16S rRNA (uracil1498-N3)-methyltransferase